MSYFIDVAQRKYPNSTPVNIIGWTDSLVKTQTRTLHDHGGQYVHIAAGGVSLQASSSSAADTGLLVLVSGLNENWDEQVKFFVLNGQTPVDITGTFLFAHVVRVFATTQFLAGDVYVYTSGSDVTAGVPDNDVDVKAKVRSSPLAGDSGTRFSSWYISHNGFYAVPRNKVLYVHNISGQTTSNNEIYLAGLAIARDGSGNLTAPIHANPIPVTGVRFTVNFSIPPRIEGFNILEFAGYVDSGGGATGVGSVLSQCELVSK